MAARDGSGDATEMKLRGLALGIGDALDVAEIDERGAMHAEEELGRQSLLPGFQRAADKKREPSARRASV